MNYTHLTIENEQILVINDTVDIKISKTSEGYTIKVLDNKIFPVTLELSDNCEEFED